MKIPILTYHSLDIHGTGYASNDLVAFAHDLEQVHASGYEVLPLSRVVDLWLGDRAALESRRIVALTCDDGSDFDYRDLPHPVAGPTRSILNVLKDFRGSRRAPSFAPSVTSFVIVSPQARDTLDRTCLIGRGWWGDDWWQPAVGTGLMEIASHGWDHNHESLPEGRFPGVPRGNFAFIDNDEIADYQIAQAAEFLRARAPNPGAGLFAYPYGKANAFLARDYFPRRAEAIGVKVAFADKPEPLHPGSDRWQMPRYVFKRDWNTPEGLRAVLAESG